jgi:hypothetical protein
LKVQRVAEMTILSLERDNNLMTVTVDDSSGSGQAISNDVTGVTITMPSTVLDVTGVNSSGMERLLSLADLQITLNGVFNDAANLSHAVLKNYRTLAASQVGRTTALVHSGQTLSDEILYSAYDLTRGNDGSLNWTAPGSLSDGGVPAWS